MKSDVKNHIHIEDIDYSQTKKNSIWGDGDPETLILLKKLISEKKIFGNWLHFASGDGRYNNLLLSEVDSLMATDIDGGALKKLKKETPKKLLKKLLIKEQNITKPFPFKKNTFDGVFNTGTLHLFPASILKSIFHEVFRVLNKGIFIFDFATDVKREKSDGSLIGRSKIEYSASKAKELLTKLLKKNNFKPHFFKCSVPPEKVTSGDGAYTFSCNYWLVIAEKKF